MKPRLASTPAPGPTRPRAADDQRAALAGRNGRHLDLRAFGRPGSGRA